MLREEINDTVGIKIIEYPKLELDGEHIPEYGTCDHIGQLEDKIISKLKLIHQKTGRMFFISTGIVIKEEQPKEMGWRWHKWGPYIGDKKPTTEYLYDEPDFDYVMLWSIKEAIPEVNDEKK